MKHDLVWSKTGSVLEQQSPDLLKQIRIISGRTDCLVTDDIGLSAAPVLDSFLVQVSSNALRKLSNALQSLHWQPEGPRAGLQASYCIIATDTGRAQALFYLPNKATCCAHTRSMSAALLLYSLETCNLWELPPEAVGALLCAKDGACPGATSGAYQRTLCPVRSDVYRPQNYYCNNPGPSLLKNYWCYNISKKSLQMQI